MATATDETTETRDGEVVDLDKARGRSIEDMAAEHEANGGDEEPEVEQPVPPMQLPLTGSRDTISSSFGGAKPSKSEMRLMGGKQPITGQFEKGETVFLLVEAKVTGVLGQDIVDGWGNAQETIRRHHARIIDCKVYTPGKS